MHIVGSLEERAITSDGDDQAVAMEIRNVLEFRTVMIFVWNIGMRKEPEYGINRPTLCIVTLPELLGVCRRAHELTECGIPRLGVHLLGAFLVGNEHVVEH